MNNVLGGVSKPILHALAEKLLPLQGMRGAVEVLFHDMPEQKCYFVICNLYRPRTSTCHQNTGICGTIAPRFAYSRTVCGLFGVGFTTPKSV
jgi:hypothetical protein